MQNDFQLNVGAIRRRLRACYHDQEVVTMTADGYARATYGDVAERVDRLGRVLERLGVERGDRVATFAWNSQRHFELYFAVPSYGAVLHTLNIRLFPEQIAYIVNHAEDRSSSSTARSCEPLGKLAPTLRRRRHYVVMGDGDLGALPNALSYEELLGRRAPASSTGPTCAERRRRRCATRAARPATPRACSTRTARSRCTRPRSAWPTGSACRAADRVLTIVPMFHANAWGLPFGAALAGAELLMPGPFLQAEPLARFIADERATLIAGVPTSCRRSSPRRRDGGDLSSLRGGVCGGAAVPRRLMERYESAGRARPPGVGDDRDEPLCTVALPPPEAEGEEHWRYRTTVGRTIPWVELGLVDGDGSRRRGTARIGEIQVRGPWIAARYYEDPSGDEKFEDGWLRTGDIGEIDEQGYVRITDRAKDLIKSGGEWISSVEVENALMGHPDVREAAVIAMPDERWSERPLACVALADGSDASTDDLRNHLASSLAKWQVPDAFAFIDEVPKTSVGKFDKKVLRSRLADGELEVKRAEPVS